MPAMPRGSTSLEAAGPGGPRRPGKAHRGPCRNSPCGLVLTCRARLTPWGWLGVAPSAGRVSPGRTEAVCGLSNDQSQLE